MPVDGLEDRRRQVREKTRELDGGHGAVEQGHGALGWTDDLDAVPLGTGEQLLVREHLVPIVHVPGGRGLELVHAVGPREPAGGLRHAERVLVPLGLDGFHMRLECPANLVQALALGGGHRGLSVHTSAPSTRSW